jgi:hypothetical protein
VFWATFSSSTGTLAVMPKALRPRPGQRANTGPRRRAGLPSEVVSELRHTARAGKADAAMARLERAVQLLERADAKGSAAEANKAKDLAPRSAAVREVLGLSYYQLERFREALAEMQT